MGLLVCWASSAAAQYVPNSMTWEFPGNIILYDQATPLAPFSVGQETLFGQAGTGICAIDSTGTTHCMGGGVSTGTVPQLAVYNTAATITATPVAQAGAVAPDTTGQWAKIFNPSQMTFAGAPQATTRAGPYIPMLSSPSTITLGQGTCVGDTTPNTCEQGFGVNTPLQPWTSNLGGICSDGFPQWCWCNAQCYPQFAAYALEGGAQNCPSTDQTCWSVVFTADPNPFESVDEFAGAYRLKNSGNTTVARRIGPTTGALLAPQFEASDTNTTNGSGDFGVDQIVNGNRIIYGLPALNALTNATGQLTGGMYGMDYVPAAGSAGWSVSGIVGVDFEPFNGAANYDVTNVTGVLVNDMTGGIVANASCTAQAKPVSCCTGAGTGTCDATSHLRIGLQSAVSAGTNKWNIFDSGTANNAFAGNVRIGDTTAPVGALEVNGAIPSSPTSLVEVFAPTNTITSDMQLVELFKGTTTVGAGGVLRGISPKHLNGQGAGSGAKVLFTGNPNAFGSVEMFTEDTDYWTQTNTSIQTGPFTAYGDGRRWNIDASAANSPTFVINNGIAHAISSGVNTQGIQFTTTCNGGGCTGTPTGTVQEFDGMELGGFTSCQAPWTITQFTGQFQTSPGGTCHVTNETGMDLNLTQGTTRISTISRDAGTTMRHAGNVRIGDIAAPTHTLELTSAGAGPMIETLDDTASITGTVVAIKPFVSGLSLGTGFALQGIDTVGETYTMSGNPNAFGSGNFFAYSPTIKTANATAITTTGFSGLFVAPTFQADGAALTMNTVLVDGFVGVDWEPAWNVINSGTGSIGTTTALHTKGVVQTGWTVTNFNPIKIDNPSRTGTITNLLGIDIAKLTGATALNAGIRNASPTINTPSTAQTLAAGTTIVCDATVVQVVQTSGGTITLSANPLIAAGQPGQECTIVNVSTLAADIFVMPNGNNTRFPGAANFNLAGAGGSITLSYNGTLGLWVTIASAL